MKSKISAKGSGKKASKIAKSAPGIVETKAAQLDQIAEVEMSQEQRVAREKEKLAQEELSAKQAMADAEKHAEETLRAEAREELTAYKAELLKMMDSQTKETAAHMKELDALYAKRARQEASRLITEYLHSHAAA